MKNVYIYCEGQSEESFIREVIAPYFVNQNIYIYPIICTTKRTLERKYSGGISDYKKIRSELIRICKSHSNELITTMFDYYGLPENTPGYDLKERDIYGKVKLMEEQISADIGQPNCKFNIVVHEFEGLLFSKTEAFSLITDDSTVKEISKIKESYGNPELINNSPETAPSKRLSKLIRRYSKVKNGTIVAKEIGINSILENCPHFLEWIRFIQGKCSV